MTSCLSNTRQRRQEVRQSSSSCLCVLVKCVSALSSLFFFIAFFSAMGNWGLYQEGGRRLWVKEVSLCLYGPCSQGTSQNSVKMHTRSALLCSFPILPQFCGDWRRLSPRPMDPFLEHERTKSLSWNCEITQPRIKWNPAFNSILLCNFFLTSVTGEYIRSQKAVCFIRIECVWCVIFSIFVVM